MKARTLPPCACSAGVKHEPGCPLGMWLDGCALAADEALNRSRLMAVARNLSEQIERLEGASDD